MRAQPRGQRVRGDERFSQPFGRLEGTQGGVVTAADELEHAAAVDQSHPRGRIGFGPDGAFGVAEGPLRLLGPALGDHRHAQGQVGHAGDRFIGPPVPGTDRGRLRIGAQPAARSGTGSRRLR